MKTLIITAVLVAVYAILYNVAKALKKLNDIPDDIEKNDDWTNDLI